MDLAECRWSDHQSPFGGEATGANPTDRGKQGTKRSVLTDGQGIPLAVVVAGANRHDMKLLAATLDAVVIERPEPTDATPQHLCADKGYDYAECREEAARQEYIAHIRSRGEERQATQAIPGYRARRWVVEVCHSWFNRFRKILVRFEKKLATHLALLQLACAYIVLKRADVFR
jgi:putative transposase